MCGIVGYIGNNNCVPILIEGLKRLEYRGYDSAGIGIIDKNVSIIEKYKGKVSILEDNVYKKKLSATLGIGHTRWATHGEPNKINAHPHQNNDKDLFLIHNGIIENYQILKELLAKKGYKFYSQTDTEVLANLIDFHFKKTKDLLKG